jgi:hypothetical protein
LYEHTYRCVLQQTGCGSLDGNKRGDSAVALDTSTEERKEEVKGGASSTVREEVLHMLLRDDGDLADSCGNFVAKGADAATTAAA